MSSKVKMKASGYDEVIRVYKEMIVVQNTLIHQFESDPDDAFSIKDTMVSESYKMLSKINELYEDFKNTFQRVEV